MIVNHLLTKPAYYGMIIPFGDYKNASIRDAPIGQVLTTIDVPPKQVRIISKSLINVKADVTDALSMLLYRVPMKVAYEVMRRSWKYDIGEDIALLLVVEEVKKNDV